jgi:phage shock protein A
MKIFTNLVSLIASVGIAVGTMYIYFPAAYAAVAGRVSFLPITQSIKKAAPDQEYARLLKQMQHGAINLHRGRARLLKNRGDIEAMIREYTSRRQRAEILLNDARRIYQANPDAQVVNFANQPYSLQDFGIQIEAISRQSAAYDKSLKTLNQARTKLNDMWTELAARESQLAADRAIIVAAIASNQAAYLIDGLDSDTLSGYANANQSLNRQLRTIAELLNEAESYKPLKFADTYAHAGLSNTAKQILTHQTGPLEQASGNH